ncbi:MAG: hypothetical protein RL757_3133, partial [Bacteroidota bacterium]
NSILTICFFSITTLAAQKVGVNVIGLPVTTLDVNGSASLREGAALTVVAGTNNDVALGNFSIFRLPILGGGISITGFAGGNDGRILTLLNGSGQTLTLVNQLTSSAANQITTGTNADITISNNGSVTLIYNSTFTKWLVTSVQSAVGTNWSINGNTTGSTNFLGTTNVQDLVFKTNNTEMGRFNSSGTLGFDVANHFAAGSSGAINNNLTAVISENYTSVPTLATASLYLYQTRTEASPISTTDAYGINNELTYRISGNATTGAGYGIRSRLNTDGNYGFKTLSSGLYITSVGGSSAAQERAMGVYGITQNDGTGTINDGTGLYGDVTSVSTGTVTNASGVTGWAFINGTGTLTNAFGFRGGTGLNAAATGNIINGYGGSFDSYNAGNNTGVKGTAYVAKAGTYTNHFGGNFTAYTDHASATSNNVYGIYCNAYRQTGSLNNAYGAYFNSVGAAVTNYGIYANVGNSATNNYLLYGNVTNGVNTDWGVYITGEDKNYFSNNVGIGTNTPTSKLYVSGENSPVITVTGNGTANTDAYTQGGIHFYEAGNSNWGFITDMISPTLLSTKYDNLNAYRIRTILSGVQTDAITVLQNGRVGINLGNDIGAKSMLELNGSFATPINFTASNMTLGDNHYTIVLTGAATITLPTASTVARRMYVIVNNSGSVRTISSYVPFGGGTATTVANASSITVQSDGINWYRIQ